MWDGFDTCVYCIVLNDAGSDVLPHERLRLLGSDMHLCEICGTQWRYEQNTGWRREARPA